MVKLAVVAATLGAVLAGCDAGTTIQACVARSDGAVRIVSPSQRCWAGEYRTEWAQKGEPGAAGPQGPAGKDGRGGRDGETGARGERGPAGLSVRSGEGSPDVALGELGEFYLDVVAAELYGPKSDRGWGEPVELAGPAGRDGVDGQAGTDGRDGADGQTGRDGVDGSRLHLGEGIPSGDATDGDMYLDEVSFDLYGRQEGAWAHVGNLRGPQGPVGPAGPTGPGGPAGATGERGEQGPIGLPGLQGLSGPQGVAGIAGADGRDGAAGRDGADGRDGAAGSRISRGTGAPGALPAADGDMYLDTGTFELYSRTGGAWVPLGSLRGATGATGATGERGPKGDRGEPGLQGPPGPDPRFGSNRPNVLAGSGTDCTIGAVWLTAASRAAGAIPAEGQLLAIQNNMALYAVVGPRFGGNGTTTFALPDLRNQAPNGLAYVICTEGVFPSTH